MAQSTIEGFNAPKCGTDDLRRAVDDKLRLKLDIVGTQTISTDLHHVKQLFEELLPTNANAYTKAAFTIIILHRYAETFDVKLVSPGILGFLKSECFAMLGTIDYRRLYSDQILHERYNEILIKYFCQPNELDCLRLYESLVRCLDSEATSNELSFLQVFTTDRLFECQLHERIHSLVLHYNIDCFENIIERESLRKKLFSYFYQLAFSCAVSKAYTRAYEITNVAMSLTLDSVDKFEFEQLLSVSVFLTMMLNKDRFNLPVHLIKYRAKMNAQSYKVLRNYVTFDLLPFILSFHLLVKESEMQHNKVLSMLYNHESLIKLTKELIDNKVQAVIEKYDRHLIHEYIETINKSIEKLNGRLEKHGLQIPLYSPDFVKLKKKTGVRELVSDASKLIDISRMEDTI